MTPETAKRMNELARMTPEQRDADLVREIFGPVFDAMFQGSLPTDIPVPKPYLEDAP